MQNTFSSTIGTMPGGIEASQSTARPHFNDQDTARLHSNNQATAQSISVNQTREHNPNTTFPTAQALIRRSARVNVEFTREAWKQFVALKGNIFTALIQAFTVKADMALYITAHEEKGIRLDNICQEVCYERGVFFLMKNIRGTWYITEVFTTGEEEAYALGILLDPHQARLRRAGRQGATPLAQAGGTVHRRTHQLIRRYL